VIIYHILDIDIINQLYLSNSLSLHGGLSFKGLFHCNFIMDFEVRMNKYVCSFDSCCDLFSSMSFVF